MSTEPPAEQQPDQHLRPAGSSVGSEPEQGHAGDAARARELEVRVERLGDRLAEMAEVSERRRRQIEALQARSEALKADNAGLRGKPAVRAGRRLAGVVRRSRRLASRSGTAARDGLGRLGVLPPGWHRIRATPGDESRLLADLGSALPPPPAPSRTRVGVVLVASGGPVAPGGGLRERLARSQVVLAGVVTAPDGPGALALAARDLDADAILVASDTLTPVEDGWLRRMVAVVDAGTADAVGACVIHGRRSGAHVGPPGEAADLTIRHLGIRFETEGGMPRPRFTGWGEDPRGALRGERLREVPAVAACVLVRRAVFDAAASPADPPGADAIDLSLRVTSRGGRVAVTSEAMLLDPGAGRGLGPEAAVVDRLDRTMGPYLFRQVLRDRLAGGGTWSAAPLRVAIVLPDGAEGRRHGPAPRDLAAALGGRGWAVRVGTEAARAGDDVVVLLAPAARDAGRAAPGAVRISVVDEADGSPGASTGPEGVDIVVPATAVAGEAAAVSPAEGLSQRIADALDRWAAAPRVAIVVGAETVERARTWGDWYFADALRRAFARRGVPAVVTARGEAAQPRVATADVTMALFGGATHETRPGQVNVLWIISHPDRVTRSVCDAFDLLLAASDRFARDLGRRLGRPVQPLHQATDPDRFHPEPTGPRHELLFIGNSRGTRRPILDDLRDTEHDLAVYGRNWAPGLLEPRRLRGDWVPNEELGAYYAAADIVLSDHWSDMRDDGFIANRIYDAAAAGGFVISDHLPEIDAEFDGGVVTYRDAADLRTLVDHFLADPADRAAHAALARSAVLERHTFALRADAILRAVAPSLLERGVVTPGMSGKP